MFCNQCGQPIASVTVSVVAAAAATGTVRGTGFDCARVRHIVENAVRSHGWQFKTVLMKGKATY